RLGVAWSWPRADFVVRASYDRAFQTPAIENLLLASSSAVESVNTNVLRLPVRPSVGDFLEVGISKRLVSRLRLDLTHFNRRMTNFADDDVLLNTGVSFPIALHGADIRGTEVKLELPTWREFSGLLSYANMVGTGSLPITGGLLLGEDVEAYISSTERLPISQDQRNTLRGRLNYRLSSKASLAAAVSYGSGLPVEFSGDINQATTQYGSRIVDRVDFERHRVRPSASFDASFTYIVFQTDRRRIRLQADVANVTNRLNVIHFSGLFSGNALGPPRSVLVRMQSEF